MVAVPQQYVQLIDNAAKRTGLPAAVVAAQINAESGFNPGVNSSAGAQGFAQFLPSTWSGLGCPGSPYNAADAMNCYSVFMGSLLKQFNGNVRSALAAYNAGPGNIGAGMGYADSILSAAGQSPGITAGGGTGGGSGPGGTGATPTDCIVGWSGLFGIGKFCLLSKSEARALIGGACIMVGGGAIVVGILVLAAGAFQRTGGLGKAADVAAVIPGAQPLAAGLAVAQRRTTRTGAQAASRRAARRGQGQNGGDSAQRPQTPAQPAPEGA